MKRLSDRPDLLSRLGTIQGELVAETHRMVRAASALEELPRGRDFAEALVITLRAACEHLGFDRAYAYLVQGDAIELRCAWPRGQRIAGWLERRAIAVNRPASSRSGKVIVVPLPPVAGTVGALRLERRTAKPASGDHLAAIMRFAEAAARALENAVLAERVRSQDSRIESLSDRLAEANHRIKNNLQVLAGFLAEHEPRPGRGTSPHSSSQALRTGISRISAIANLHDALSYAEDELADVAALAHRICLDTAAVDQVTDRIKVLVTAEPVRAAPGVCRALALILHELVCNALRHAYPGGERGEVRVSLRRRDRTVILEVADDGVGTAAESKAGHKGMGLRIASAIAENELGGKLELDAANGTTAKLEFPLTEMA